MKQASVHVECYNQGVDANQNRKVAVWNSKKTQSRSPKISNSCSSSSVLLCCSNVESRRVVTLILLKGHLQMFRYLKLSNYSILLL